jgi:hypothetical protein
MASNGGTPVSLVPGTVPGLGWTGGRDRQIYLSCPLSPSRQQIDLRRFPQRLVAERDDLLPLGEVG